jgi:hypothetical protein
MNSSILLCSPGADLEEGAEDEDDDEEATMAVGGTGTGGAGGANERVPIGTAPIAAPAAALGV